MRISYEIIEAYDVSEKTPKKLFIGTDAAKELKQSEEMLFYGQVTNTGIKFLGMDVIIDHNLPKERRFLK